MIKIILDPNLFECDPNANELYQMEHCQYLISCIQFLDDCCDVTLDAYQGAPYFFSYNPFSKPPITNAHYVKVRYNEIQKSIQRIINKEITFIDISNSKKAIIIKNFSFIDDSQCRDAFLDYLETQIDNIENCFIILGMRNNPNQVEIEFNGTETTLPAIINPQYDCSNRVVDILAPPQDESDMFPGKTACLGLNDSFIKEAKQKHLNSTDKISIMRKYGIEFASRNRYIKNDKMAKSNSQYVVFIHRNGEFAISIDQEHGGLEVFKKSGRTKKHREGKESSFTHIGEYSYAGDQTKKAEPTNHILYD